MTKRKKRGLIAGLIVAGAVATAVLVIIFGFKTKKIVYEGNTRLEDAQITEYVFEGKLPNSIIYKIFGKKNKHVPFVQKYDVSIQDPNTLKLTIHEREYLGFFKTESGYNYFDDTGTVTDISDRLIDGVVEIEGIEFAPVEEGADISEANGEMKEKIMSFAKAFNEHQIPSDKISFDENGDVSIKIKDVTVLCGSDEYVEEKMDRLTRIIPEMEDLKGILHLERFDGTEKNLYFNKVE